jgi:3',5'-cyclic AMP phosphodiesterase CpdA
MIFLHLSDTHLLSGEPAELYGVEPAAAVRRVLDHIAGLPVAPAFCLVSGDLTHDGAPASYAQLRMLLAPLEARGVPVLLGLGNHDDRAAFRQVFGDGPAGPADGAYCYSRVIGDLRVLMLDSLLPGQVAGALGAEQLSWLADHLQTPAPGGDLLVVHHPLVSPGVPWLAGELLQDTAELLAVLAGRPLLGILSGHCHCGGSTVVAGTLNATAPATIFQFEPHPRDGQKIRPGSGYNLCAIDAGRLIVNPVLVP